MGRGTNRSRSVGSQGTWEKGLRDVGTAWATRLDYLMDFLTYSVLKRILILLLLDACSNPKAGPLAAASGLRACPSVLLGNSEARLIPVL